MMNLKPAMILNNASANGDDDDGCAIVSSSLGLFSSGKLSVTNSKAAQRSTPGHTVNIPVRTTEQLEAILSSSATGRMIGGEWKTRNTSKNLLNSKLTWYPVLKPARRLRLFAIDLETTGFLPCKVVQIALVDCANINNTYAQIVNPGIPISKDATSVHGIRHCHVKDSPMFSRRVGAMR